MKVLIVEDEKGISKFLKKSLETECFTIDLAEDGEKGAEVAIGNKYDIIILDNVLPKKMGNVVCREIRQAGIVTPIIMLSVKSETATKVDLLNAGADDYLTKPFSLEELLARIRALLRRPKYIAEEIIKIHDLEIDKKKHVIRRGGKEIYLTRKEFMLLEYLIKHQGIVLSRGMILEHVWDMNADPFSNTIESHILSLRRKINANDKKNFIKTIPGIGYKAEKDPESEKK